MSKIILITGPSGVGKGTIEKELFKDDSLNLEFSVSATTRKKRDYEIEGQHYYFISKEKFEQLIKQNAFLEYSNHLDNYYGTLISEVETKLSNHKNVLIEVETTGAINIINKLNQMKKSHLLTSIFIIPPSLKELENRIKKRNTDNEDQIKKRLKKAKEELNFKIYFQYIVKNDNINIAIKKIKSIIRKD